MLNVWSSTSFPVFTFKCMDTELSACKHSKVSAAVLNLLGTESFACWLSDEWSTVPEKSLFYYSYIQISFTWKVHGSLPFHLRPVRLLLSANRIWESMPWVSRDATSLFCQAQMVRKNDGFQSARLSKIWTVVSLAIMTWHLKSLLSIIKKQNQFYGS